jgi:hypothetical protein
MKTVLVAPTTFYLNPSTGNDSNDGNTPATAWRTIGGATGNAYNGYDFNGQVVTMQLAPGTYGGTEISLRPDGLAGAGHWIWRGDPANPWGVAIFASSGHYALAAAGNAAYTLDGVFLYNSAYNQDLLAIAKGSDVIARNVNFGLLLPGPWNHVSVYKGASYTVPKGSEQWITGGAQTHVYASGDVFYETDGNPNLIKIGFTRPGTRFSVGFVYANGDGRAEIPAVNFINKDYVVGPRAYAEAGGMIWVASGVPGGEFSNAYDYLPGDLPVRTVSNATYHTSPAHGLASIFDAQGQRYFIA